jgi:hypothetical protein
VASQRLPPPNSGAQSWFGPGADWQTPTVPPCALRQERRPPPQTGKVLDVLPQTSPASAGWAVQTPFGSEGKGVAQKSSPYMQLLVDHDALTTQGSPRRGLGVQVPLPASAANSQ